MGRCLVSFKEFPPSRRHNGDTSAATCFSKEISPMDQRISLITLDVIDLPQSRHFYEHGLGWQPSSASNEQMTFFQTADKRHDTRPVWESGSGTGCPSIP